MSESLPSSRRSSRPWRLLALIFGVCASVMVVVFVGMRVIYGMVAASRLERELAAVRTLGEPLDFAQFQSDPLPPREENRYAATELVAQRIDRKSDFGKRQHDMDESVADVFWFGHLHSIEREMLEPWIAQNADTLIELDRVARLRETSFVYDPSLPALIGQQTDFAALREAAQLRFDAASLAADSGDFGEAWRHVEGIAAIAEVAATDPSMIGHLVAIGCDAMRADAMHRLATMTPDHSVDASLYRTAIRQLLDETSLDVGFRRALLGERVMQQDMLTGLKQGKAGLDGKAWSWRVRLLVSPWVDDNAAAALLHMRHVLARIGKPDLLSQQALVQARPTPIEQAPQHRRHALVNILVPALDRVTRSHYRARSERRLAAVSLAVRLYRLDNDNAVPDSLDALVPAYLPQVPVDALDGQPIRYDAQRKRIWSVGDDLDDDDGTVAFDLASDLSTYESRQSTDLVQHLTPQPKPSVSRWTATHGLSILQWLDARLPGDYVERDAIGEPRKLRISRVLAEGKPNTDAIEFSVLSIAMDSNARTTLPLVIRPSCEGYAIAQWQGRTLLMGVSEEDSGALLTPEMDDEATTTPGIYVDAETLSLDGIDWVSMIFPLESEPVPTTPGLD